MLEHGAELDQAASKIEISIIINDAEILYRKHLAELNLLNIPVVVRQSEQLFCPKCGMHERIIGCSVHDYLCNDCGNVWSK